MKSQNSQIKIKIDPDKLTAEDLDDLYRWENEGGLLSEKPDIIGNLLQPLQKGKVFEVSDYDIIIEDDQLYFLVTINSVS